VAYDRNKSSPKITSNLCFYVDYHTIWPPRVIVSHYLQIILRLFGVDIDENINFIYIILVNFVRRPAEKSEF
jgi:hypothetical protein